MKREKKSRQHSLSKQVNFRLKSGHYDKADLALGFTVNVVGEPCVMQFMFLITLFNKITVSFHKIDNC